MKRKSLACVLGISFGLLVMSIAQAHVIVALASCLPAGDMYGLKLHGKNRTGAFKIKAAYFTLALVFMVLLSSGRAIAADYIWYELLDFILGTHPITTKGTTQVEGGAKRRSAFDV